MTGGVSVTFSGNLTRDPVLRILENGTSVAGFSVACNERFRSKETGEWTNASTTFLDVSVWNDKGANVCASLHRGHAVVVTGTLRTREYTNAEGVARTVLEVRADSVGVDLSRQTTSITKVIREHTAAEDSTEETGDGAQEEVRELAEAVPF